MKVKTPKNSPIAVLYSAANQIVAGTRKAFESQGKDARELRLPILMHGTDMRVTIEAGPKVAARNAIEHAQMQASGKPVEPTVDMSKIIQQAQSLLGMFAADLIDRHRQSNPNPGSAEWNRARDDATRCLDTVEGLRELERLL